jgi:ADP-ribosylglycohydrolase
MIAFIRDPRVGYSQFMYKTLSEAKSVDDFKSRSDWKGMTSGGAMRAAPFGLLPNIEFAKTLSRQQAAITHGTPAGTNAALAVTLATHFLHHGGTQRHMMNFIHHHLGPNWNSPANGYTPETGNGLNIVTQALDIVIKSKNLSEILLNGVNYAPKTDTDSVCAMAMVIASRCPDIVNDLPDNLYSDMENGTYGVDHLQSFDRLLLKAFPRHPLYIYGFQPKGPTSSPA